MIQWLLESLGISFSRMIFIAVVAGGAVLAGTTWYYSVKREAFKAGYVAGQEVIKKEIAKQTQKKVNDASKASAASRRCSADPKCLYADDGYKRD